MHRIESVLRRMFPAARPHTHRDLPPATRPAPKPLAALESPYRCELTAWGADQPTLSLPLPRVEPSASERRRPHEESIRPFLLGDWDD